MATYTLTMTITDTYSTLAGELAYQVRSAASGGGSLLASGTATSGVEFTTSTINDTALVHGSNQRFLYVTDGAGNVLDQSFTVTAELIKSSTMHATGTSTATVTGILAYLWSGMAATGSGTATVTGIIFSLFPSTDMHATGKGTASADGVIAYLWSEMVATGTGAATATGIVAYRSSAMHATGIGIATVTGIVAYRSSAMHATGIGIATVTGYVYPILTSLPVSRAKAHPTDLITVAIYPPLGVYPRERLDYIDINPQVTALHWRSGPGGWTDAGVGLAHPIARYGEGLDNPYLPRALYTAPFAHVEILRGPNVVFAGRLGAVERPGGVTSGFTVNGYGIAATRDNEIRTSSTTLVTSGQMLQSFLAETSPHLRAATGDDWVDPGVAHEPKEFDVYHIADALDQIKIEGDSAGNPMDWWVFEDQLLVLKPRREPDQPHYAASWRNVTAWNEDVNSMVGSATYERTVAGEPTTSSTYQINTDFAATNGFQKSVVLRLGEVSEAAALAITKTYLRRHSEPIVSASLAFGPDDPLVGPGGRVMPKETARYGQWLQVGREEMQMIVSTDYDATGDVLRMEIGEFVPGLGTEIAALQQDRLKRQRKLSSRAGRQR